MNKKVIDAFVETQESIVAEIDYAREELICGRKEEAYNILTNLSNELMADIIISKGETAEEKFCRLIKAGGKRYIENEYKKELSNSDQTEDNSN